MKKLLAFIPLVASILACAPSNQFFADLKKDSNTNKTYVGESIESNYGSGVYYDFISLVFYSADLTATLTLSPSDFTAKKGDATLTGEFFIGNYTSINQNGVSKWYINETLSSVTVQAEEGEFNGPHLVAFSTDLDNTYDIYYKTTKLVAGADTAI